MVRDLNSMYANMFGTVVTGMVPLADQQLDCLRDLVNDGKADRLSAFGFDENHISQVQQRLDRWRGKN
jgi:hypothetical protein